jgi:hypothetical protein
VEREVEALAVRQRAGEVDEHEVAAERIELDGLVR